MKNPKKTPLESWIARKIGLQDGQKLTRQKLALHQLDKFVETLEHARRNSPFYKRLLADYPPETVASLRDVSRLPFTSAEDIRRDPNLFLCVSRDRIARVVTLRTSGTTHKPKRVFFTDADLELTADFFHQGMSTLVRPGQKVLILMPGELPGSVGDLLVKGLARMDVEGVVHGPVANISAALDEIVSKKIDSLVGIPAQVMAMARSRQGARIKPGRIKSVLLSADYIPKAVVSAIEKAWHCPVFQHYGMTETGLGGGVECEALDGYHMREADLYYEIVDPESGKPVPEGETGEVVFTTLTRQAMPLIRYRTGDLASFIPSPCPCGTTLRRMSPVAGRIRREDDPENPLGISMPDLDETVYAVDEVMNYQAEMTAEKNCVRLKIQATTEFEDTVVIAEKIRQALKAVQPIREAANRNELIMDEIEFVGPLSPSKGAAKRRIAYYKDNHEKPEFHQ